MADLALQSAHPAQTDCHVSAVGSRGGWGSGHADLVAGNVDVAMEWIQVQHFSELAELGYTQAEIHVFLLGPGRLKLNLHDVPQLGKRMVEAVRALGISAARPPGRRFASEPRA